MKKVLVSLLAMLFLSSSMSAQEKLFEKYKHLFTTPLSYVAPYTTIEPVIDGNINDKAWADVPWTTYFQDIEGDAKPKPYFKTRAKMMWDSTYLYFAAEMEEPHVWAKLKNRDEIVFFDNDFEIFLNPNNSTHQYFEIEINALNTIFDLYMNKPYREDAGALFAWDTQGMKHAVQIQGSLNNPDDKDQGWTVEFAIPWRAFTVGNAVHIPKNGEFWRLNFSRVQWDTHVEDGEYIKDKDAKGRTKPENNWVWSAQGVIDMHRPERWGYLLFSTNTTAEKLPSFVMPQSEKMRNYLWLIYYKQKEYKAKNNRFATTLKQLDIPTTVTVDGVKCQLQLEATSNLFEASIKNSNHNITINNEGLVK